MSIHNNDRECVKTKVYSVRQYTQHGEGYDHVVIDEEVLTYYKHAVKLIRIYNDDRVSVDILYHALPYLKHCVKIDRDFMNAYIVLSYVYSELRMTYEYNCAMSNVYRCSGIR